jgi:hypothetical protein
MRVRHVLVISGVTLLLTPANARGAVTGWSDVTVRVYDTSGAITGTKDAALDFAGKTLSSASIDVTWRLCPAANAAGKAVVADAEAEASALRETSACDRPMRHGELAIRIVRTHMPESYHGALPLGDALIDIGAGSGVLATIYLDRVIWLARQAHTDRQMLLGRAIAHELGHLLMATSTHGPVGLMRAVWSEDEVRRERSRDWMFAAEEISAIHRRIESRRLAELDAWGTR